MVTNVVLNRDEVTDGQPKQRFQCVFDCLKKDLGVNMSSHGRIVVA